MKDKIEKNIFNDIKAIEDNKKRSELLSISNFMDGVPDNLKVKFLSLVRNRGLEYATKRFNEFDPKLKEEREKTIGKFLSIIPDDFLSQINVFYKNRSFESKEDVFYFLISQYVKSFGKRYGEKDEKIIHNLFVNNDNKILEPLLKRFPRINKFLTKEKQISENKFKDIKNDVALAHQKEKYLDSEEMVVKALEHIKGQPIFGDDTIKDFAFDYESTYGQPVLYIMTDEGDTGIYLVDDEEFEFDDNFVSDNDMYTLNKIKDFFEKNDINESWIPEETETGEIKEVLSEGEIKGIERTKNGIIYRGEKFPGYNKPKNYNGKGDFKKRVLAKEGDKIRIINYGDKNYSDYTKHKDPKRRTNFRKRHNCDPVSKLSKLTKKYWACQDLW